MNCERDRGFWNYSVSVRTEGNARPLCPDTVLSFYFLCLIKRVSVLEIVLAIFKNVILTQTICTYAEEVEKSIPSVFEF